MLHTEVKTSELIAMVLNNLRIEDEIEMIFEFGNNWKDIIYNSALNSDITIIADEQNNPVGLFGIREIDKDTAQVCLLATPHLTDNSISFLLKGKKVVKEWMNKYKKLENYIYKHNKNGIRMLKILGFNLVDFNQNKMYFFMAKS